MSSPLPAAASTDAPFRLSAQQRAFFDTFGFVRLPGLFAPDIDRITAGFEEIFASHPIWETNEALHFDQRRLIIPGFVENSERISWITSDPRTHGVVGSLIDVPYEYAQSDGNLFYCDTSWHPDNYKAPMHVYHVKLSFYLDPLHGQNGAIRMIPGSNFWQTPFAEELRRNTVDPSSIEEIYGVAPDQIPSWTLESEPGDVIAWNFRTIHASFNGGERRRLFSLNFREITPD
jgi:Phytanoyl-CoA dioxygenase (PhyH)